MVGSSCPRLQRSFGVQGCEVTCCGDGLTSVWLWVWSEVFTTAPLESQLHSCGVPLLFSASYSSLLFGLPTLLPGPSPLLCFLWEPGCVFPEGPPGPAAAVVAWRPIHHGEEATAAVREPRLKAQDTAALVRDYMGRKWPGGVLGTGWGREAER